MPRTTLSTLKSAAATACLAGALTATMLAAPAHAGGSVAFTLTPTSAQDAQAMRAGLTIYSLVNGFSSGSGITQNGFANIAGLAQNGTGNVGVVHQQGSGHSGTLTQNGNGNAHGLFQFGSGSGANVVQNGNGDTGATFAFGW